MHTQRVTVQGRGRGGRRRGRGGFSRSWSRRPLKRASTSPQDAQKAMEAWLLGPSGDATRDSLGVVGGVCGRVCMLVGIWTVFSTNKISWQVPQIPSLGMMHSRL